MYHIIDGRSCSHRFVTKPEIVVDKAGNQHNCEPGQVIVSFEDGDIQIMSLTKFIGISGQNSIYRPLSSQD